MRLTIKYDEILNNSEKLNNITKEYDEIINNISLINQNIANIWISDNQKIAEENLKKINDNLKKNNNYYKIFANLIKSINDDFLLTEQEANKYLLINNKNINGEV